jgi:hypothetical protein
MLYPFDPCTSVLVYKVFDDFFIKTISNNRVMARGSCPPGVFCLSEGILVVLGVVLLFLFIVIYLMKSPHTIVFPSSQHQSMLAAAPPAVMINQNGGGDSRYDRAPQPLRDWMGRPEFPPRGGLSSIPINIPTQGLPETFQSVGIINVGEQVLPLYGRRTTGSSDRWNYYTRTDTYNPVPVPVQFGRRDCMDDTGCQEIMSGESVAIDALHKEGKTNIYRMGGPKYIPGLI